ncbi:RNA-directed DNA polymerase, eukaryota, reverse transcriptase zinc-binding domain protein [Tanacetum coccineum]
MYANVARFNRDIKHSVSQKSYSNVPLNSSKPSYAKVVKKNEIPKNHDEPVMVLEDVVLNFEGNPILVGSVKDFKTLSNLHNVIYSEGFSGFKITYLGSFWVLLEFDTFQSCESFDVEGVPLKAWSKSSFNKITTKWGEFIFMDDSNSSNKYSMRLCVKTTLQQLIAESFKVILKGKVYVVHAKEVTGWAPKFGEDTSNQLEDFSDNNSVGTKNWVESEDDDAHENTQKTLKDDDDVNTQKTPKDLSGDPFGLEDLIFKSSKKGTKEAQKTNNINPKFPSGFTPQHTNQSGNKKVVDMHERTPSQASKQVTNNQTCHQDMEETKMVSFDVFVVKAFWGNMLFDFATSSARGRSGGILCVWDKSLFHKKRTYATEHCIFVEDLWNNDGVFASNFMILLKNKLKCLKQRLKDWSSVKKRSKNHDRKILHDSFIEIELHLDKGECLPDYLSKRATILRIKGIFVNGEWIDNPIRVKSEFYTYFLNIFSAPDSNRVPFEGNFPRRLDYEQSCDLEGVVSNEEIKRAIWDCGSDKSPGPDGFTFEFFKKYLSIIGGDVINVFKEFFNSSSFPKGCNSSFIALIPKVLDAKKLNEFRPISLIGCQYKIIGKILANRLSLVIGDIVSQEQSAFIKGRQIMDGPLILNELISWCKARKEKCLLFKVDFQKAFDSVRWDHLDDILGKFGFGNKWRGWIRGCLNSSKAFAYKFPSKGLLIEVPEGILSHLEKLHNKFFLGADPDDRKITWVSWKKVLAHKNQGGLGVNNFARQMCGDLGFIRRFLQAFNLELQKDVSVAIKLQAPTVACSFRRPPRSGRREEIVAQLLIDFPTRSNLYNRGIDIPCVLCPNYEAGIESRNHLFFSCSMCRIDIP